MTAILKDWKGFTSSREIPSPLPYIKIPIYHRKKPVLELAELVSERENNYHVLTFRFKDWISESPKIGLYEQEIA